jgi:hypothetical protein
MAENAAPVGLDMAIVEDDLNGIGGHLASLQNQITLAFQPGAQMAHIVAELAAIRAAVNETRVDVAATRGEVAANHRALERRLTAT